MAGIIRPEYEFNHYGDRGSVDLLAWHPTERVLLIIEVKSALTDLQATLMSYARKLRIVPDLVAHARGGTHGAWADCSSWPARGRTAIVVAQHPVDLRGELPATGHRGAAVDAPLRTEALGGAVVCCA